MRQPRRQQIGKQRLRQSLAALRVGRIADRLAQHRAMLSERAIRAQLVKHQVARHLHRLALGRTPRRGGVRLTQLSEVLVAYRVGEYANKSLFRQALEPAESLGSALKLPEQFQPARAEIEATLPPLHGARQYA